MDGYCVCMKEVRNTRRILCPDTQMNRPLGKTGILWEDNVETGLWEMGYEVVGFSIGFS